MIGLIINLLSGTMVIRLEMPKRDKKSECLLLGIHPDGGIGVPEDEKSET